MDPGCSTSIIYTFSAVSGRFPGNDKQQQRCDMEREREMLPEICPANELSVNTGHSDKYYTL
jgi:hypothetical protein